MPNQITSAGLQVKTRQELIDQLTAAYQSIYGSDISLSSDSPDGQMMNIFVQSALDLQDLLVQIYNQFDPDNAIGTVLDQRVALNGIQRQAGTYTTTNITLVMSAPATLYGLDQTLRPVYTVQDSAGNQWQLQVTQTPSGPGTYIYLFQAQNAGATLTVPNSINLPVTIILGVASINNPTTYSVLGLNEETDAALKIRRQQSVLLSSQGYLSGLLGALENITGVSSAFVYENNTGGIDSSGVPGHSIWVIVAGSAAALDIANAIYRKRNAGCGMFGATSYTITQIDGSPFIVYWDVVTPQTLFVKFTASSLDGINPPNIASIRSALVTSLAPGVYAQVNINDLATLVKQIDSNCLVTGAGFSLSSGGVYTNTLTPTTKANQFAITSPNIIITPMILSPTPVTVTHALTQQFTPLGGFGAMTYSMFSNVSGGSVSAAGLYTAGAVLGVDVVRVTDSLGNTGDATVTVI